PIPRSGRPASPETTCPRGRHGPGRSPARPPRGSSSDARRAVSTALFITPFARVDALEFQRLLVQDGRPVRPLVLPGADEAAVLVVALRLALGGLVLLAEVGAARLVAGQRVQGQ